MAISYVATLLLLRLVDQNKVGLDDKLAKWLPDVPNADRVTLGQLAQMTSGYPDYVLGNAEFEAAFLADLFRQWTPQQLLSYAVNKPLLYPPGTNWNYAHTNYVLLGLALEKATGRDMPSLLRDEVLGPLRIDRHHQFVHPAIPEPALHAFSSERRQALGIPPGTSFYEDSTFWNPSWTITHGAVQTTTIHDLEATAAGLGSGRLLSRGVLSADGLARVAGPDPRPARMPTCGPQTDSTPMVWAWCCRATGCCRTRCSVGTPRSRRTCPRRRSRSPSPSPSPRTPSTQPVTTATRPTPCSGASAEVAPGHAPPLPPANNPPAGIG